MGLALAAGGAFIATQNTASKIAVPMVVVGVVLILMDIWCR